MRVKVLGSAAGGGFPQWNCNCRNCAGVREGRVKARRRTQSSIAVSADGERWILCNASPDITAQILATPELQARDALRGSRIAAVVLTDGQIDHAAGLLLLREGARLPIHTTDLVREDLTDGLPVLSLLEHFCGVDWHRIPLDGSAFDAGVEGLELRAVPLPGKPAPFSPRRDAPQPGDNIGLVIRDRRAQRNLFYAPGLARVDRPVRDAMMGADCVLVDGTFWTDDEMIRLGVGSKRAQDIGHLAQDGPGGMIEQLRGFRHARRILVHINNTNPILDEASAERRVLEREGIEVAFDGMEVVL
jgi:pyrroloquinoline quinone biosynthesis protein B